ncbi:MAG: GNAT family N-acetyltransferase [Candidatus Bathyarchaeia archaeon]
MPLVTTHLEKIFNPKSVALVGATDREGSVGRALMTNLIESGFEGNIYPVNIRKKEVLGFKAYQSVEEIPETVDLAVIATPARSIPEIVEQCGRANIKGIVIISAGFREIGPEGKELEDKILEVKQKYGLRIIGPNSLGVMRPKIRLNATLLNRMPKPGNIAFITQSAALGAATLDWAIHENIGFSYFVSIGSMIDVDFGDLIDYFGTDPETRSILMYVEGITDARKFMSAARHFARTKPIIVVKAGKFSESAKAAASHTGSLTGEDQIYDAAFKRAGIVRVDEISDLFNCAEALGLQPLPKGSNLAIITNAGGPAVVATDVLIARGGKLATLSPKTIDMLSKTLPNYCSVTNPIDLLEEANADRYKAALETCLKDEKVDGVLIIYTAQAMSDPVEVAKAIIEVYKSFKFYGKTVLTSFIGHGAIEEANRILNENGIPTHPTPEQAIKTYLYMYQYKRNLELLYETPEELPVDFSPPKRPITAAMRSAVMEGREILTEIEAKKVLEFYGIPVVKTYVAKTADEAARLASQIGYPVVVKVLSPHITHKTEAGGVALNLNNEADVRSAFERVVKAAKEYNPTAEIQGVVVQKMINGRGYELMIGAKKDKIFGPVVLFGVGGVATEVYKDYAIGLPPLNQTLIKRLIEETKVYHLLKGYRGMPPANMKLLEEILMRFSQLLVDFPHIKEIDVNPLWISDKEAYVLDARIVIDKDLVFKNVEPHHHLVISPYPKKYEALWRMRDGRTVLLRPIKPEDEPLWLEMFQNFSEESIRFRFFQILKDTPHEVRVRYCNIDYEREIAIVAELNDGGRRRILGVVRIGLEPDRKKGEIAFIVADPWQGLGLGTKMVDYAIEIANEMGVETIYAIMLPDNVKALNLLRNMGFTIKAMEDGNLKATLNLKEEKPQEMSFEIQKVMNEEAESSSLG